MQHLIRTYHKRLCLLKRKIKAYVPASNPIQNKLHVRCLCYKNSKKKQQKKKKQNKKTQKKKRERVQHSFTKVCHHI